MTISNGYNYIGKDIIGAISVNKNFFPILISNDNSNSIYLPIDTTSITNISDYTFSSIDLTSKKMTSIKKISPNYNWRYFVKIIYNTNMSSSIQIQKNYTSPGFFNIKVYPINNSLNATNQTVFVDQHTTTTSTTTTTTDTTTTTTLTSTTDSTSTTNTTYQTSTLVSAISTTFFNSTTSTTTTSSTSLVSSSFLVDLLFNFISNNNNASLSSNSTQEINLYAVDVNVINNIISSNFDISDCLQNCSNSGNCKLSNNNKLICSCFDGYSGSSCNTITNPCISNNPCLNNSTCVYAPNATSLYECKCGQSKYYGTNCEFRYDLCSNRTCSDHGVCEIDEAKNMPFCSCFKFFSGSNCEIQSAELKAIQTIDSIALVISILFIIAIYAVFVLNDILNYFLCMKIKLKIQREKEKDELIEKKKKKKRNSKHLKKIYPS